MKTYFLTLLVIVLLTGNSCQETIDIEKEKTAIIKVLNEASEAFAAHDMKRLSDLHVKDELVTRLAGTKIYSGWSEIEINMQSVIEINKKDTLSKNFKNFKENIILKVTGNNAWLICDNIRKWDVNGEPNVSENYQIAFFEKIKGEWKFSFNAFVNKTQAK